MTLQQIEYICAVAEEGSISKASRRLHTAQPPISRQLQLLENELGVQLFIRNSQGVTLTQAGQKFYQESRQLKHGIENMIAGMRDIDQGILGTLEIGIEYSVSPYGLPRIAEFKKAYPGVDLKIHVDTTQGLENMLHRGDIHVLFTRVDAVSQADLNKKPVGEDPLELIMTRELDPAPELEEIPVALLQDVPFCQLQTSDDWNYGTYLFDACQRHGVTPKIACQCLSSHIAVQVVLSGLGVVYLPRSITKTVPGSGIYSKPVQGLHPASPAILVWSDDIYMPPCGRLFTEMA